MTTSTNDADGKSARVRRSAVDPTIGFYRQPGGCIEISQTEAGGPANSNDVVHICGDADLRVFVAELVAFAAEVHGISGLDPDAPSGDSDA